MHVSTSLLFVAMDGRRDNSAILPVFRQMTQANILQIRFTTKQCKHSPQPNGNGRKFPFSSCPPYIIGNTFRSSDLSHSIRAKVSSHSSNTLSQWSPEKWITCNIIRQFWLAMICNQPRLIVHLQHDQHSASEQLSLYHSHATWQKV